MCLWAATVVVGVIGRGTKIRGRGGVHRHLQGGVGVQRLGDREERDRYIVLDVQSWLNVCSRLVGPRTHVDR